MNWHIARGQSGNTKVDIGNKRPATFSYISIPELGLLQNSPLIHRQTSRFAQAGRVWLQ